MTKHNAKPEGGRLAAEPHPGKLRAWIEAMRLRTLPVSVAGVLMGVGLAMHRGHFDWLPAVLCLLFAVVAQIGCNFANEYYDFVGGLDRPGREGPRRGVTEGDITPAAMQRAMSLTFILAAIIGCSLVVWGGWWLILVGIFIFVGALSYSAGPFPLSRNAMGEIAVVVFFGLIPVGFTFYLQAGYFSYLDFFAGLAIGLMGSNILIVNNYRDRDDDAAVGKLTTAVVFGRKAVAWAYLINGYLAVALTFDVWREAGWWTFIFPALYLVGHTCLWLTMRRREGHRLNQLLGMTAMLMLLFALAFLCVNIKYVCCSAS